MSIPYWGHSQGIPVSSLPVPHHSPLPNFPPLSALWAHFLHISVTWWACLQHSQTSHNERGFVHDLGQKRSQEMQLDQEGKNLCLFLAETTTSKPPVAFPWSQCSVSWAWLFQDLHHSRPHSNLGQARATTRELFPWMTWGCQTCFYWFILMVLIFFKWSWGFASSPVVRTLHFHCRGHRFDLVGELRSCMLHSGAKNYLHFTFIIYINKNR